MSIVICSDNQVMLSLGDSQALDIRMAGGRKEDHNGVCACACSRVFSSYSLTSLKLAYIDIYSYVFSRNMLLLFLNITGTKC